MERKHIAHIPVEVPEIVPVMEKAIQGEYESMFRKTYPLSAGLLDIFFKYGEENQLKKLSEELLELNEAIGVFQEVPSDAAWNHLVEEAGDVTVVMLQFILSNTFDKDEFVSVIRYKIARQISRIREEEEKHQQA